VTIQPGDYIVCDNNGIVVNESDPREVGNSWQFLTRHLWQRLWLDGKCWKSMIVIKH
jgi:hypothetical protein